MHPSPQQPDPAARWLSHAIVGAGLAALFAKKQGTLVTFLVAIVGAYAHEQLDAPLADVLSDFGI